jgi:hypothetical protein
MRVDSRHASTYIFISLSGFARLSQVLDGDGDASMTFASKAPCSIGVA